MQCRTAQKKKNSKFQIDKDDAPLSTPGSLQNQFTTTSPAIRHVYGITTTGQSVFSSAKKAMMLESPQTEKKRTIKAISTLNQSGSYLATRDPDNKGIRMSANST
jgi:hypothetical protein